MASKAYQNQKRTLKYSKSRVNKAGREIRLGCSGETREEEIEIIQNYRETHLYPLMLIKNHIFQWSRKVDKKSIVARRLKRLPTILDKLERPTLDGKSANAIQLTRMHDIGGCRAIVANLSNLKELHKALTKSKSIHKIIKTYDYLSPKDSGYSGIHIIYSCFNESEEKNEWSKTKIEVQLRTELQHAWATSLEIIDTLENINLKTSLTGHEDLREFFKLSGQLVAHEEKACELSDTEKTKIRKRLKELENQLTIIAKLGKYNLAIQMVTSTQKLPRRVQKHQGLFLVNMSVPKKVKGKKNEMNISVELTGFSPKDTEMALSELAKSEGDKNIMISVLISAGDARSLKKAYPNYFGSTQVFQKFIKKQIE